MKKVLLVFLQILLVVFRLRKAANARD